MARERAKSFGVEPELHAGRLLRIVKISAWREAAHRLQRGRTRHRATLGAQVAHVAPGVGEWTYGIMRGGGRRPTAVSRSLEQVPSPRCGAGGAASSLLFSAGSASVAPHHYPSAIWQNPVGGKACLPRTVEGAGGVEGTLPKRQEQRRWERPAPKCSWTAVLDHERRQN